MITRVGIFAYPAGHTASPAMHNSAFKKLGLPWMYEAFEVKPEDLKDAVDKIRKDDIRGVNVTIPHKVAVIPFLDEISENAKAIGAVNTIINKNGLLTGENTDAFGFIQALKEGVRDKEKTFNISNVCAVLLGAGGAARAVAVALGQKGLKSCGIYDVENVKAEELKDHLNKHFPDLVVKCLTQSTRDPYISDSELIINCSPIGMAKFSGSPVRHDIIQKQHIVFDLVYNPEWTEFRREGEKRGALTIGGLGMLVWQGAKAFELWTGQKAPVQVMRDAAMEYLKEH